MSFPNDWVLQSYKKFLIYNTFFLFFFILCFFALSIGLLCKGTKNFEYTILL